MLDTDHGYNTYGCIINIHQAGIAEIGKADTDGLHEPRYVRSPSYIDVFATITPAVLPKSSSWVADQLSFNGNMLLVR